MRNWKVLVVLAVLRKTIEIFASFFLNIYLFKIVGGDFNFLLLYAAYGALLGVVMCYFLLKNINSKNAVLIFRLSFVFEIIGMLMLLIMRENIIQVIWLFGAITRYAKTSYYAVYETTLIRSAKDRSVSSYVAGVNILGSIVTLIAPVTMGFIISDFSYEVVFVLMLLDALVAACLASKIDFAVINYDFNLPAFWKKAFKNKTMKNAYKTIFLKRLSGTDGVLEYLLPILLFISLGTEFSAGSYESFFSVIYVIMLEIVRMFNKKGIRKRFYIPLSLLTLTSAIVMVSNFSVSTVLLFYLTIKTGMALVVTESVSMIYAVGIKEDLVEYTREHQFTWNIFLALGNFTGILIAYIVYNNFYGQESFAVVVVALVAFSVVQSYFLQKVESKLGNK